MASYSVTAAQIGAHAKTLVANTVDTVTFADDIGEVEVVSNGSAAIYFTTDGTTPTVGGAATHYLPASSSVRRVKFTGSDASAIKLISAGTPTYSVARVTD
jgi:hypothetical protein